MDRAKDILKKHEYGGVISYADFSLAIHDLLISDGGYVLDTGSNLQVNAVCLRRLVEKIEKHPLLWKLFFTIA